MDRPTSGFSLAELAAHTGTVLEGDGGTRIRRVGTLEHAAGDAIAFLANPRYSPQLAVTRAGAVIVAPADADRTTLPKLVSDNPYATYARVAALLHPEATPASGIHPTAIIDPAATVAADASVGAYAVIGPRAGIGAAASVGAGSVVGADASIGERALVHANVVVYPRCVIGARTIVHAGAVIGADGFGMAEESGRWVRVPQLGRVVVGDDCEIGANTTIDRGAIDDTIIEDDVKLDNQIQIGHNCTIGRHTAIAGCVGIAGSTHIGRNCRIGGAAMISGHLTIPDGTVVSGGTLIASTLDESGVHTGVFPSLPHREWRRVAAHLRRLDELVERVRALERRGKVADE
jgi:UDP-3-O-[3-hydroxymyristoyl] glucosamine N-acyltransferase